MDTNDPPEAWHGDLPSAVARITPDHLILQQQATVRRLQCSACSKVLQATPRHKAQPRHICGKCGLEIIFFINLAFSVCSPFPSLYMITGLITEPHISLMA